MEVISNPAIEFEDSLKLQSSSNSSPNSPTSSNNHEAVKPSSVTSAATPEKHIQGGAKKHCFCLQRVKVVYVLLSAVIFVEWAVLTLPITFFLLPTDSNKVRLICIACSKVLITSYEMTVCIQLAKPSRMG